MGEPLSTDRKSELLAGQWQQLAQKQAKNSEPAKFTPYHSTELTRTKNPSGLVPSLDNAKRAILKLGVTFRLDQFRGRIVVEGYNKPFGESIDDIELKVRDFVNEEMGFDPEPKHTRDAIRLLAMQNAFNPVREYLDGLQWDGVPRLETWLSRYLGAVDDELNRAIGRAVLIAGVRRVRKPGCKFDYVLVLEGPQGRGKSSALKVLAGGEDYFSDEIVLGENYKDQQELLRGKWIVEMPEMAGLGTAEVRRVKQFVSKTHDRARGAFQRTVEDMPRTCILIGTTNDAEYLRDMTGNRRFWPVATGRIDLAGLREARDQLWAEAAAAEVDAESDITIPELLWDEAARRQAERVAADPWEDILEDRLSTFARVVEGELRITTQDIFEHVLKLDTRAMRQADTRRIGDCMRRLGWEGPKVLWIEGKGVRGYAKAASDMANRSDPGIDPNWSNQLG